MQTTFETSLSFFLAHSVVFFTREELSPNGIVDDARAGGDPAAPSTNESMASILAAYQQQLPGLINSTASQILPFEQAQLAAEQKVAPGYQALNNQLYQKYAPQIAATEQGIQSQLLTSPQAQQQIAASLALQRQVDPEFFASRAKANQSLQDLLGSFNISGGLTGGEQANVERGLNRMNLGDGSSGLNSGSSAISAALNFDDRLQAKKSALSQVLSTVPALLSSSKSGMDAFQQVTGKPGQTQGANFLGVNQNLSSNSAGLGNNLLNQAGNVQNTNANINANRRDTLDRVTQVMGAGPSC